MRLLCPNRLTTERKKRTVPKETATEDQIKSLHVTSSHPTHSSSKPGILCLDLHPNQKLVQDASTRPPSCKVTLY
jgi:hypothetical protein